MLFVDFYAENLPLASLIARRALPPHKREDAIQEGFARLFAKFDEDNPPTRGEVCRAFRAACRVVRESRESDRLARRRKKLGLTMHNPPKGRVSPPEWESTVRAACAPIAMPPPVEDAPARLTHRIELIDLADSLTPLERDVLMLAKEGHLPPQIGEKLGYSVRTVYNAIASAGLKARQ